MEAKPARESADAAEDLRAGLLAADDLQKLLDALIERGYVILGPTARSGAIVNDRVTNVDQLPLRVIDEQEAGTYRLTPSPEAGYFTHVVGPQGWKTFLFPPERRLWAAERPRPGDPFETTLDEPVVEKTALLGVRACELAAMAIQDRIFLNGPYPDPLYAARRSAALIIAVNCARAARTCFCASMGTGPSVLDGFDLLLTEIVTPHRHDFVVEASGEAGREILDALPCREVSEADFAAAEKVVHRAASAMHRSLETADVHQLLLSHLDHPRWNEVADRCLACANCTMVCPTCFCLTVQDATDLTGTRAERWQKWDSCFTLEHSYIHGGSVRTSRKARYRQWLTHKLASWVDQFGTFGCVGCGRCITWCPAGIDITEEVRAIRESSGAKPKVP